MRSRTTKKEAIGLLWYRGDLTFKLHAGQKLIYDKLSQLPKHARQIVFLCGRRFGKSYLTLVLAIEACLRNRNTRILLCAPYKSQSGEIAGPLMAKVTADMPSGLITQHRSSHRWNFLNGSTLILSGLDLLAETIRGTEFDDIYLEESGSAAPDDFLYVIKSILFPTLLKSRGRIFHVTTLSRFEDHPLHTDILPKADKNGALFTFPTRACPLYTKEQLSEMCAEVGGEDSISWKREFECIQVRDGSIVAIPEFNYDIVREFNVPPYYKAWLAGDWGGVRDKTAFVLMGYDFDRAKIVAIDEAVFDKHTTTASIVSAVKAMEERWHVRPPRFVDCPGQLQIDLMDPLGLGFPVALPQKDKFEISVNLVRMNIQHLEIHPRCKELIQTLKYARLNKARTDFERTEAHGHADALMALCYGLRYVNKANPYPSAALNTHAGSHYVSKDHDLITQSKSAAALASLFKG